MAYRVHLDYASTAPLCDFAKQEIQKAVETPFFDPRRLYNQAIESRYVIETYRANIAQFFNCEPFEVIFTSSHAESLATFAYGALEKGRQIQKDFENQINVNMISSPYDSDVIYKTWLREKVEIRTPNGNEYATLDLKNLYELVDNNTCAINVPWVHPDTGAIQNIDEISKIINEKNASCFFHVDARLAVGNIKIDFKEMDVGAISVDPTTFGGPTGISALILSRKYHLAPLLIGASQERARRAGLENFIGIAGFSGAIDFLKNNGDDISKNNTTLKEKVLHALSNSGAIIIGHNSKELKTLNNMCAAYFPGVGASAVVQEFNRQGINIHAGSSCGSEEFEPSQQLVAVVGNTDIAESVFRVSWGWATTEKDIDLFIKALENLPYNK